MNQSVGQNLFSPRKEVHKIDMEQNKEELIENEDMKMRRWLKNFMEKEAEVNLDQTSDDYMYMIFSGTIDCLSGGAAESEQVKWTLVYGPDWELVSGKHTGVSQEAMSHNAEVGEKVVNLPFEFGLRTTNLQGWPQLVVQTYSHDIVGRSMVTGYGSQHLPVLGGQHQRTMHLFKPLPVGLLSGFMGYLKGINTHLIKPIKTLAHSDGRELLRVTHASTLHYTLHLLQLNMHAHGFINNHKHS